MPFAAPLDAPKDILPAVAEDNTVNITWSGPSEPNGPIKNCNRYFQSYTIYFAPDDGTADEDCKSWPRIEVPSTEDHGTITIDKDQYEIKPNMPYKKALQVCISATNDLSEGPASEPTMFETGSGGKQGTDLYSPLECNSWSNSVSAGVFRDCDRNYLFLETPPVITLDPPQTVVSVEPKGSVSIVCSATGIPQPTVYWVMENGERAGGTQEVIQIQISGPGTPPNEIVLLPMPNQVINVEWTTPDEVNGRITNYIVHYGEVATVDGLDVNHQLQQLDPKKNYAVRVQAVSDRGPGVISAPQMIRTLPLDISVFDNNSVIIEFVPPADPESPGKQIKVSNVCSKRLLQTAL
ncbi:unnamed protein product [Strongylus vulgaris]|uniref:Fibronectin type-III domain-containing protein n=1 Tax=Strongylus vulgaris TaxID=40348 RepID=A0A3P7J5N9_STRVU|nr:unnamed protein product [Strongylus vulgaris]